jgi:hypothetical protein
MYKFKFCPLKLFYLLINFFRQTDLNELKKKKLNIIIK